MGTYGFAVLVDLRALLAGRGHGVGDLEGLVCGLLVDSLRGDWEGEGLTASLVGMAVPMVTAKKLARARMEKVFMVLRE